MHLYVRYATLTKSNNCVCGCFLFLTVLPTLPISHYIKIAKIFIFIQRKDSSANLTFTRYLQTTQQTKFLHLYLFRKKPNMFTSSALHNKLTYTGGLTYEIVTIKFAASSKRARLFSEAFHGTCLE